VSDWKPTRATLRDGEQTDDAHARRNLAQIRKGLDDGVIEPDELPPERREALELDTGEGSP
jgi:hypothetical protein